MQTNECRFVPRLAIARPWLASRITDGHAFCTALRQFKIAKIASCGAPSGKSQHIRTDVYANHATIRAHRYGRSFGHSSGSCAEIEYIFVGAQIGPSDHCLDDRREPLVDLPQINIRDSIPNPSLPRKTFSVLIGIDHRPHSKPSTGLDQCTGYGSAILLP
jgi:hypothetical protein